MKEVSSHYTKYESSENNYGMLEIDVVFIGTFNYHFSLLKGGLT